MGISFFDLAARFQWSAVVASRNGETGVCKPKLEKAAKFKQNYLILAVQDGINTFCDS